MKFIISNTDGWRWNLTASNGKVICSGEAYQRPQKMVQTLEKYIIRDDPVLQRALTLALYQFDLDPSGKQIRTPSADENGMHWVS